MENPSKPLKYIDLNGILRSSNSSFLRKMPGFIIKLIEKIIRQDEMNRLLWKFKDCQDLDFHDRVVKEFNLNIEIEGEENLPENSKCFFVSNHPFGVIDGLILTRIVGHKYGDFKAIGNDAFLLLPNLRPHIAAVNVYGKTSKEYVNALEEVYESDIAITHFPAGKVSRIYEWRIQDCEWQKSFITKAISCKRDVVPFRIYGRNSRFFYTVFLLRKLFRISANIELALLPQEMFNKRNKRIRVKIGKPIAWQTFDKSITHLEWAQKIRESVYNGEEKSIV